MPSPRKDESKKDFISRCMSSEKSKKDFPDNDQRFAFCNSQWENKTKAGIDILAENLIKKIKKED